MAVLRYAAQEAANIKKAESRATQQSRLNASIAKRKAEAHADAADAAKLQWSAVPASASSSGTAGQVAYDGTHFYVCVTTDTWCRASIATW